MFEQQLVRRIDEQGRSIGRYFREEIAEPLMADFYIGVQEDVDPRRLAGMKMISPKGTRGTDHQYRVGYAYVMNKMDFYGMNYP